jgi:CBS domain-containing protein
MSELQYKMKAKSRYQPSETVDVLFKIAIAKIKADSEKTIAKQKVMPETDAVSAQAEIEAKAKEPIPEQKAKPEVETEAAIEASAIEPETEPSEQTTANETKSETEPVSQKETTETFESESEQEAETAEQKTEDAEEVFEDVVEEKVEPEVETEAAIEASAIEPETEPSEQTTANETKSEAEPVSQKETAESFESESEQEAETAEQKTEDAEEVFEDVAEEKAEITAESQEPAAGEVSKSIQQMVQSQSNQPREQSPAGSGLCAKDVMLKELVWGSPEDSVQQAITKIQQYAGGYLMVGIDGVLEGIVSNSNITGALSPYLRSVFAKWRGPLDDATLQIRIKWIMNRPVHTVKPQTPLANIMENMCRYGVMCLPVIDQQGKVQGLVTETDIFKALLELKSSPGISVSGNENKEQSAFDPFSDHREIESTPTMEADLVAPV